MEFAGRMPGNEDAQAQTDLGYGAAFPVGGPNPFSRYFTGNTYLSSMVPYEDVFHCPSMSNVTFEPCARTDWHSHDRGGIPGGRRELGDREELCCGWKSLQEKRRE